MATGIQVNDQAANQDNSAQASNGSADVAIKTENLTYKVFVKVDAAGKVEPKETVYASSDKQIEKYSADQSLTLGKTQTVRTYKAGSIQGFLDLIGDDEEALNIINRGVAQKFSQKIADYLTSFDETTQAFTNPESEEVFDSRELLQEPTQRRNLTVTEKAMKSLKTLGFSEDKIMAMLQQLQAAQ